jgi:hypothetical protein
MAVDESDQASADDVGRVGRHVGTANAVETETTTVMPKVVL